MSEDGKFETYLCEYPYKGQRWAIEIKASSWEDARGRLKALAWTEIKGITVMKVPVPLGGTIHRLWRWLRGDFP